MTTPPLAGTPTQDLVRDVAHVVGHRSGPGVREDHGRLGDVERGGHRPGRDVTEVDQHPEPVHLAHDLATERGQAVVLRRIGRGVGPARRSPVGERHVADAAGVELAQGRHRARDHRPAFEADQRRDAAGAEGCFHLVRRRRQCERVGIALDEAVDDIELLERHPEGLGLGQVRRDPDRPELAADAALAKTRDVGVETVHVAAQVDRRRPHAPDALTQSEGQVVVAVDERRLPQDRAGALGEPVVWRRHGPPSSIEDRRAQDWSGRRDSNPRSRAPKARALPTTLLPADSCSGTTHAS